MRKTFLTKGFVRFSRGLAGAALIAAAIGITSCETHSNSDRNESIKVYADPIAKEPIDAGIVGVKGGLAKLYVDANIDFVATWEDDAATPWAKVVDYSSTDPPPWPTASLRRGPRWWITLRQIPRRGFA